jgi:phage gp36-like protein
MPAPSPQQYATAADLSNLGLASQALSVITPDEQNAALLAASQTADGYLNSRFVFPLINWGTDLKTHVCEIAAFTLLSTRGYNPDANSIVRDRYKDAIRWLEQVAADKITPVITDSSVPQGNQPDGQAGTSGFAFSVGAPINQPFGGLGGPPDGGGVNSFWGNSASLAFQLRGAGGRTRGF